MLQGVAAPCPRPDTAPARGAGSLTLLWGGGAVWWRAAPLSPPRHRPSPGSPTRLLVGGAVRWGPAPLHELKKNSLLFSTFFPQVVAFFLTLVTFFPFSMFRV